MTIRFDHAVVVVDDLAAAIRDYEAAGFRVTPGGRHDVVPTVNALIPFADGSYLELLALRDDEARASLALRRRRPDFAAELKRGSAVGRRLFPRLARPAGVADAVFAIAGLARFAAEARRRGFPLTGPTPMSRQRAGAAALEWDLALPESDALPFFIEDRIPRELRVPGGAAADHPNRAAGIAALTVRAPAVPAAALEWSGLFDLAPRAHPDGRAGFALGGIRVTVEPGEPAGACGLTLRGVAALDPAVRDHGISPGPAT